MDRSSIKKQLPLICPEAYIETIASHHFEIGMFISSKDKFNNAKNHFVSANIESAEYYASQDTYFNVSHFPTLKSLRLRTYKAGNLQHIVSMILSFNLDNFSMQEEFLIANFNATYLSLVLKNIEQLFHSHSMFVLDKTSTKISIGEQRIFEFDCNLLTLNFDTITNIKTINNYIQKKFYLDSEYLIEIEWTDSTSNMQEVIKQQVVDYLNKTGATFSSKINKSNCYIVQ
jgi:hypothetical protein